MRAPRGLASRDDALARLPGVSVTRTSPSWLSFLSNDTKRCLDRGAFWWKTEIRPLRARDARPLASLDAAAAAAAGARAVHPDAGPDDELDGAPAPSRRPDGRLALRFVIAAAGGQRNHEVQPHAAAVDSMMNGASSSRSHVEIKPVYDARREREKLTVSRSPARSPPPQQRDQPLPLPSPRDFPRPQCAATALQRRVRPPRSVGSFPAKLAFPCDVLEKKREFLITADLPGLSKDVVNVTVDDERRLHMHRRSRRRAATRKGWPDDENVKMHVYERTYGKVERMFKLPENVEDEKIEADMKNALGAHPQAARARQGADPGTRH